MTLVSSANILVCDKVFILGGRTFMGIMISEGPRIDTWGTHSLWFLNFRKNSDFS
jgi:hypothetical protein